MVLFFAGMVIGGCIVGTLFCIADYFFRAKQAVQSITEEVWPQELPPADMLEVRMAQADARRHGYATYLLH